jgi:pimeloyl-ACP methyl ester carboxylesterase
VLVLLHGLCMNDLQWLRDGHDHGAALARALWATRRSTCATTAASMSRSMGGRFAQLDAAGAAWPVPVQRLVLLGHSMGGLVARSAVHQAQQAGRPGRSGGRHLVCLGTPHHGAPLERAGQLGGHLLLGATPYAAPFARLGKVRSAGITDLRHGNLLDEDWLGRDRFAPAPTGACRCRCPAPYNAPMRILIANDDGYLAPGIAALVQACRGWATSTSSRPSRTPAARPTR